MLNRTKFSARAIFLTRYCGRDFSIDLALGLRFIEACATSSAAILAQWPRCFH